MLAGFEPATKAISSVRQCFKPLSHNTSHLNIHDFGVLRGIRTHTVWILSPFSLPVGIQGQLVSDDGFEPPT